jgi:hypothetical protein
MGREQPAPALGFMDGGYTAFREAVDDGQRDTLDIPDDKASHTSLHLDEPWLQPASATGKSVLCDSH